MDPLILASGKESAKEWKENKFAAVRYTPRQLAEEVCVKIDGLEFPRRCPSCGGTGDVRLERQKLLGESRQGDPEGKRVLSQWLWFCRVCAERHRGELWRPGLRDCAVRLFAGSGEALGGAVVLVVGLYFLKEAVLGISTVLLCFSALPLGIGFWLLRGNWRRNAWRFVKEPTSVMASVDFSDDESQEFEAPRMRFFFRESSYARAFRELNAQRIWDPASGEAIRARQERAWAKKKREWLQTAVIVLVVLLGILNWIFDWTD